MTSLAIKRAQRSPAQVERMGPDSWSVPSSRTEERYAVTRSRLQLKINGKPLLITRWKCGCPATTVACRHIVSVIVKEMRAKGWVASIWTSWREARRQKHRIWYMESNGQAFWVTGKVAPEVRRPDKRARFKYTVDDNWREGVTDVYWENATGPFRFAMATPERS